MKKNNILELKSEKKFSFFPQGTYTCSVCNKEFVADDDTRYIIAGGYTCSWKCFLKEAKEQEFKRKKEQKDRDKERKERK